MKRRRFCRRDFLAGAAGLAAATSLGAVLGSRVSHARTGIAELVSALPGSGASGSQTTPLSDVIALSVGSGPGQIGVRVLPDAQPEGPQSLRVGLDGNVWIVDTLNSRVQVFSPSGRVLGSMGVPDAVFLEDMALSPGGEVFLLDSGIGQVRRLRAAGTPAGSYPMSPVLLPMVTGVNLDGSGDIFAEVFARDSRRITSGGKALTRGEQEATSAAMAGIPSGLPAHSVQTKYPVVPPTRREAVMQTAGLQGEGPQVRVSVEGQLPYIRFLGVDSAGNVYLEVCELDSRGVVDGYTRTVRRYDPTGRFLGAAEVPDRGGVAPRRDLSVSPGGHVYYLRPFSERVELVRLDPSGRLPSPLVRGPEVAGSEWEEVAYRLGNDAVGQQVVVPAFLSRSDSYWIAVRYSTWNWYCSDSNYYGSSCAGRYRPGYLVLRSNIVSLAYQWGGFKTVDEFNTDMQNGMAAGDVHCDGYRSCASGVDCSGYVGRAWGLTSKPNVAGLISLCTLKSGFGNLLQGDMVALPPNSHARYFAAYNYPPTGWNVLESTTSYGGHVVGKFYLPGGGYNEYTCNVLS